MFRHPRLTLLALAAVAVVTLVLTPVPARPSGAADLVFRGGPIHTVDESTPVATSLAVQDGRIVYVGDDGGIKPWIGKSTRVIDLAGKSLIPGFVDADARLLDLGRMSTGLDLYDTRSFEDVLRKVAKAARNAPPNRWILGWGWDQESWTETGPIKLVDFQASSGNRPVVLFHATDDVVLANISALAAADIPEDLPDPPGGRIPRDSRGARTGDLQGEAASLLLRGMPVPTRAEFESWYAAAAESCLVRGVTLAHDLNVPVAARPALESLYRNGKTRPLLNLSVSLAPMPMEFESLVKQPPVDARKTPGLSIDAITLRLDGDVNTRGARITHVYADQQGNQGYSRFGHEELVEFSERLLAAGWGLVFEAHGDSAVGSALYALSAVRAVDPRPKSLLAGLDLVRPDQLALLADSGAGGIMTATHLIDGWRWMENRIGQKSVESAWAFGSLTAAGFPLAIGTDAPFAAGNPLLAFYGAVTRQDLRGRPASGWNESERLSRPAALAALTLTGATLLGQAGETGSLTVGKRADLVVLSGDLMTLPERDLPAIRVEMTVAGGRIVHERTPAKRN